MKEMPLKVAILWHFHQPLYADPLDGGMLLPWVRLHAVKDYWGMGRLIQEAGAPVNVNWVPCLIEQLERYLKGERDRHLELSAKPAVELTHEEAAFILDNFFSCNPATMIYPFPRYRWLLSKRRRGRIEAVRAVREFSVQELRDLQVWWNLVWLHPLARDELEPAGSIFKKGAAFTEAEKQALLNLHVQLMGQILPLYRQLWQQDIIEITASPFFHPILPLLCDMESAREALPKVGLPSNWRRLPEDARTQLREARASLAGTFGKAPEGLWPSEGSVSGDVLDLAAEAGFRYAATDEGILAATLRKPVRTTGGKVIPELLYKPYRFNRGKGDVAVFFRDRELSDAIGFHYQHMPEATAAKDLIERLKYVAGASPEGAIVSIILDGENAWEHYPRQGVEFVRCLYRGLLEEHILEPLTFSRYLAAQPPPERIQRIFAGSWIDRNFAVWIGAPEDRMAWEELFRAREAVTSRPPGEAADVGRALRHIYAAEGSDWFWWFGPDHVSLNNAAFDLLFRKHLQAAYRAAGLEAPGSLSTPISKIAAPEDYPPRGLVQAVLDGEVSDYFEWLAAGRVSAASGAVVAASGTSLVKALYYGYDRSAIFLRVDFEKEARPVKVRIVGATEAPATTGAPQQFALEADVSAGARFALVDTGGRKAGMGCYRRILELGLPFGALSVKQGEDAGLAVVVVLASGERVRVPAHGFVKVRVPEPTYWLEDWNV